jgi:hypothetical protein
MAWFYADLRSSPRNNAQMNKVRLADMSRWLWTTATAAALLASAVALASFVAAVDLGYDAYPGGKSIIAGWG